VLLNYMNSTWERWWRKGPARSGSIFGWPIWSVVRVVAFVFGAIAVAQISLGAVLKRAPSTAAPFAVCFSGAWPSS